METETNLLLAEAARLGWNNEVEREAVVAAINNLNTASVGVSFDDLYDGVIRHLQNVLGLVSQYDDYMAQVAQKEKRRRATVDQDLSQSINPETKKPFTRGTIEAMIELDSVPTGAGVVECVDYRLVCQARLKFLRSLDSLYRLHHERIVNVNVNARRAAETY